MARSKRADPGPDYITNAREPALGPGILVSKTDETRTYRFAGGERTFKEAYCQLYMKPVFVVAPEVRAKLTPPRVRAEVVPATPKASHRELEAQLRASRGDPDPYLVYADWLQTKNDARGELIVVQHQRAAAPRDAKLAAIEAALFAQHGNYFVPPELDEVLRLPKRGKARCDVEWFMGFLARVRLARDATPRWAEVDLDALAAALLAHPSARLLRSLVLGPLGTPVYSYITLVKAIARAKHAALEELVIGDFGPADHELASTRAGDVSPLFGALPALAALSIRAGELRLGRAVKHAALRELRIETVSGNVDPLFASTLPALETLELAGAPLRLGAEALDQLAAGKMFPKLRRLALHGTAGTKRIVEALGASPLLARLDVLELDRGDLDDPGVRRLMMQHERFAHLSRLSLGGGAVSAQAATWVTSALAGARVERAPRFPLTENRVVAIAPDHASMAAARKLARADKWLELGHDPRRGFVWGEYEGRDHYYVFASVRGTEAGCECGSAKDPCKHALALMLLAAHQHDFTERPVPDALVRHASRERPTYGRDYGDDY